MVQQCNPALPQATLAQNTADISDLMSVPLEELEAGTLSQASTTYTDDEEEDIIRNYQSQPCTQRVDSETPISNDASLEIPPSTQSFPSSTANNSSSSNTSIALGKRKGSDLAPSEPPAAKRPNLFGLQKPLSEPVFSRPSSDLDPNEPVVNSPPQLMSSWCAKLPYGAQFELARLVNIEKIKYVDLTVEKFDRIKGFTTNATAAPRIAKILLSDSGIEQIEAAINPAEDTLSPLFEKENRARNPWEELDKEQAALEVNPKYGTMGFNEDGTPSAWCGGQVHFRGTLLYSPVGFYLRLEKPTIGTSTQMARRFGGRVDDIWAIKNLFFELCEAVGGRPKEKKPEKSAHFFRFKITRSAQRAESDSLLNFCRRPFIICGSVFRAFYAKDDNVFCVKTNENWNGTIVAPGKSDPAIGAFSLKEFIMWHNSPYLNRDQAMAKWASRFSLGLSNSAPGYLLSRDSIRFMDDIVNPETGSNMTDGAGSMNRCLVRQLRHRYDWNERPSAFQVRVHGGKGLLIEDIVDHSESPIIFLTPSQIKIKYPESDNDPAHLAIDILRASHLRTPCRLSAETIVNLGENGVRKEAFVALLEASLKEIVDPLLEWDNPQAMLELWALIQRRGGVISARRAREQPGIARVKGWSERDLDETENDDEDGFTQLDTEQEKSSAWWPDPVGGSPSSLEETILYLLDAGFTPDDCPVLRDKLNHAVKGYVRRQVKSYRIEVPMSATGFIVPDRSGILAEGEVSVKSSSRNLLLVDGTYTDVLLGDVLLARHPCKLPTDIRKWKAVSRPELHQLADVIVFSTKGSRRAADWLAGGDYDGDKAIVIWQPELVEPFTNADANFADPPGVMDNFFEKEVEHVSHFLEKVSNMSEIDAIHEYQYYLLGAIRNTSVVGMYSKLHDICIYTKGYTNLETRRLAFMFCMTLDGAKTGMSVRQTTIDSDRKKFGNRSPVWKETDEEREKNNQTNDRHPMRGKHLHRFIMDDLHKEAEIQSDIWLKKIEDKFVGCKNQGVDDPMLSAPYDEILLKITGSEHDPYASDLKLIRDHVEKLYAEHESLIKSQRREYNGLRQSTSPRKSPRKDKKQAASFTELPIEDRQDILRALSRKFVAHPKPSELHMPADYANCVKASYAYVYDCKQRERNSIKWSRFPWDIAFRELCDMKARALGNHKTVSGPFYERMTLKLPKKT